jgi:hypothetical protein
MNKQNNIMEIKVEVDEMETKRQRINETKNLFFEKINKTDKHLANLTKRETTINKIGDEKVDIITIITEDQ